MILDTEITKLRGVGEQIANKFSKMGIRTFQDLLFHLPSKYVDKTRIYPIGDTRPGDKVVVIGTIISSRVLYKPKRSLIFEVEDQSGTLSVRLFHFQTSQQQMLTVGQKIKLFGEIKMLRLTSRQMIHPEYTILSQDEDSPHEVEDYLTAIYPTVEGVHQKLIHKLISQVLTLVKPIANSLDIIPIDSMVEANYPGLFDALQAIHQPTPEILNEILNKGIHPAQRRLAFEELIAQNLALRSLREDDNVGCACVVPKSIELLPKLLSMLPFTLTKAQQNVIAEIQNDMHNSRAMQRLVQGDVGSGKTLVAVASALGAIEAGLQVALMAPTEILAEQHYLNIHKYLNNLHIKMGLLTGKLKSSQKAEVARGLQVGEIDFVVGTHALFQKTVTYKNLGLIIIDEQHRFGVQQRLDLQAKGDTHQLIMSATPIPRTLAMTFYAQYDYSVIDELPPGRKPIQTLVISNDRKLEVINRIKVMCGSGQQVYWVCTLISESKHLELQDAESTHQDLQKLLPDFKVGLVHGKLKPEEKEIIMREFKSGIIDVLVATTVIEVGVDVPNASLMVIENPERLGLAQLHQLRGRVGRGCEDSYCILLYGKPLSEQAGKRLQMLRDSTDGFKIAEYDLQLRGPGEVFGTQQSGGRLFKIADLQRDKDLLPTVNKIAARLVNNKKIVDKLKERWLRYRVDYSLV